MIFIIIIIVTSCKGDNRKSYHHIYLLSWHRLHPKGTGDLQPQVAEIEIILIYLLTCVPYMDTLLFDSIAPATTGDAYS